MEFDFKEQTIIITGATRGIGKKIAEDLESLDAKLVLTGTDKNQINRLNIENANPKIIYKQLDFLDKNSLKKFLDFISNLDRIEGLINNAGINRLNKIQESLDEDWNDMINVNLSGAYYLIKAVSKVMINQKYGRILNISSIFSVIGKEKRSIYCSTKSAINGLTIGTSNDLSKYNILCNSLSPGFVKTDLTKKNLTQNQINLLSKQIPIERLAETKDISNTSIYLISNLNSYLTGQNIIVDGGFTNI